jgi:hypothetical protein
VQCYNISVICFVLHGLTVHGGVSLSLRLNAPNLFIYLCMYVRTYTRMYVCRYVRTYVRMYMYVCMYHHITTKLLRSIDTTFILSKNNELTLNGIYIVNYSVSFKNSNVRKVYKFNSQFQG